MGQTFSSGYNESNSERVLESFTKKQVIQEFAEVCISLLSKAEIDTLISKFNITSLSDNQAITISEFAYVFQLISKQEELSSSCEDFFNTVKLLYESFEVIGSFPFLLDFNSPSRTALSINDLILSCTFHTDRFNKIFASEFYYVKLLFISLCLPSVRKQTASKQIKESKEPKESNDLFAPTISEKSISNESEYYVAEIVNSNSFGDHPKIFWDSFGTIKTFDEIDVDSLEMNSYDFLNLVTLLLIISYIPQEFCTEEDNEVFKNCINNWSEFQKYGLSYLRFMNLKSTLKSMTSSSITFHTFRKILKKEPFEFVQPTFKKLFQKGCLSIPNPRSVVFNNSENQTISVAETSKFIGSKLVNDATIACISNTLMGINSNFIISKKNLFKLYTGSESGFSIRSLESKIFKWQAPSMLIVSGKRLKDKTIATNRGYQKFSSEYPRFFKSSENSKKSWQSDHDTITYAVLLSQPWRHSNKKNFGDENTVIISLSPKLDFYTSVHNPILKGESIYFNNVGLGLGFGNEQPVNKNGVKKYLPGNVSLTIEANLEFAIFRHIVAHTSAPSFLNKSTQEFLSGENFEDRFMITDLEVWGIGSTAELDEQKKQWEWERKQAEARQNINLNNLGEERAFLEMVGLVGNHNSTGGSI